MTEKHNFSSFIGGSAIAYIAALYTQRRLTDALEYIESFGLSNETALALFTIIGGVA